MKLSVIVSTISMVTVLASSSFEKDAVPPPPVPTSKPVLTDIKSVTEIGMTLTWKTDSLGMLNVTMTAPTSGWLAVGFDVTGRAMKDGNIIIGYVKDGKVVISDEYGTGWVKHEADTTIGGKNNITNASGFEKDGSTTILFTIPLDSKDKFDKPLVVDNEYDIILAYAAPGKKDFTTRHIKVKKFKVKI